MNRRTSLLESVVYLLVLAVTGCSETNVSTGPQPQADGSAMDTRVADTGVDSSQRDSATSDPADEDASSGCDGGGAGPRPAELASAQPGEVGFEQWEYVDEQTVGAGGVRAIGGWVQPSRLTIMAHPQLTGPIECEASPSAPPIDGDQLLLQVLAGHYNGVDHVAFSVAGGAEVEVDRPLAQATVADDHRPDRVTELHTPGPWQAGVYAAELTAADFAGKPTGMYEVRAKLVPADDGVERVLQGRKGLTELVGSATHRKDSSLLVWYDAGDQTRFFARLAPTAAGTPSVASASTGPDGRAPNPANLSPYGSLDAAVDAIVAAGSGASALNNAVIYVDAGVYPDLSTSTRYDNRAYLHLVPMPGVGANEIVIRPGGESQALRSLAIHGGPKRAFYFNPLEPGHPPADFTVDGAVDGATRVTLTGETLPGDVDDLMAVRLSSTGSLPGGLRADKNYWLRKRDDDSGTLYPKDQWLKVDGGADECGNFDFYTEDPDAKDGTCFGQAIAVSAAGDGVHTMAFKPRETMALGYSASRQAIYFDRVRWDARSDFWADPTDARRIGAQLLRVAPGVDFTVYTSGCRYGWISDGYSMAPNRATGQLHRHDQVQFVREDPWRTVGFVVDSTLDDLDALNTTAHRDIIHPMDGFESNYAMFNVVMRNVWAGPPPLHKAESLFANVVQAYYEGQAGPPKGLANWDGITSAPHTLVLHNSLPGIRLKAKGVHEQTAIQANVARSIDLGEEQGALRVSDNHFDNVDGAADWNVGDYTFVPAPSGNLAAGLTQKTVPVGWARVDGRWEVRRRDIAGGTTLGAVLADRP